MVEATPRISVLTLDSDGSILGWNPAAATQLRAESPGALAGLSFADVLRPPHDAAWRQVLCDIRDRDRTGAGDAVCREMVVCGLDGVTTFPALVTTAAVADDDRERYVAVVHDRTEDRRVERRLDAAREDERRRIARELHDSVGGQLTGIEIAGKLLERSLAGRSAPEVEEAARLRGHLAELQQRLREVSRGLLPVDDDPLGLLTALRRLVERQDVATDVPALSFHCDGEVEVGSPGVASHVYHIAEEALQNALRHARAEHVAVTLSREGGYVILIVEDDGVGIDAASGAASGLGLDSMVYRANLIEADLAVEPGDDGGTVVRVRVAAPAEPV